MRSRQSEHAQAPASPGLIAVTAASTLLQAGHVSSSGASDTAPAAAAAPSSIAQTPSAGIAVQVCKLL